MKKLTEAARTRLQGKLYTYTCSIVSGAMLMWIWVAVSPEAYPAVAARAWVAAACRFAGFYNGELKRPEDQAWCPCLVAT